MKPNFATLVLIGVAATLTLAALSVLLVRAERAKAAQTKAARESSYSVAWLVLVHDALTANCTRHLVARLWRPEHLFFVHADRRGGPELFARAADAVRPWGNAHVISTRFGRYRGVALVDIALDLLGAALAYPAWRHAVFLSGDAYPLQPERAIVARLRAEPHRNWLSESHTGAFPELWKTARRIPVCWSGWSTLGLRTNCSNVLHTNTSAVYWGTQWAILSRVFAVYATESPFARRLRDDLAPTSVPDESFFPTVLYGSRLPWLLDTVNDQQRDPHMMTNWARRDHLWGVEHAHRLVAESRAMFARKVRSQAVRDAIDAEIANQTTLQLRL